MIFKARVHFIIIILAIFYFTSDLYALNDRHGLKEVTTTPQSHPNVTTHVVNQDEVKKIQKEALISLKEGNKRYVESDFNKRKNWDKRREELATGQHPKTIILSCSDSRVPPELIFDQGLGDLFVIRTAGEVADKVAISSIEYALEHLGAKLLLVLGHESCGAVKAALELPHGSSSGSPNIDYLLNFITPNIASHKAIHSKGGDPLLRGAVKSQVFGVVKHLLKNSAIIREKVLSEDLQILQGVYKLSSGSVELNEWSMEEMKGEANKVEEREEKALKLIEEEGDAHAKEAPKTHHKEGKEGKEGNRKSKVLKVTILGK